MRKGLARLLLILFLLSVIYPVGLSASVLKAGEQQRDTDVQLKTAEHFSSTAKILSHTNAIDFTAYGKIKPLWTGDMHTSGEDGTIICRNLFIQNSRSVIYRQQLFKRLLFPFHFFG